jgi:hypothetical protein
MFSRTVTLTALLALSGLGLAASTASAQAIYFGVETDAETLGYTGCYNSATYLPNATFVSSVADPAGATLTSPYYGSMFADVGASAEAQQPVLHAQAISHTHSINATSGFYGSAPYGYGYAHSFDRVTVKSGSLPKGTPVTIVFGNQVDLNTWSYTGLYDGYIDMSLQIGVGTAHSRWSASYLYGVTASQAPQITVQTTVGSQFSIDGKLRAQAKTFYVDGRQLGGDIHADATARIVVLDIPAGVTLESFSGMVYPVVPAN